WRAPGHLHDAPGWHGPRPGHPLADRRRVSGLGDPRLGHVDAPRTAAGLWTSALSGWLRPGPAAIAWWARANATVHPSPLLKARFFAGLRWVLMGAASADTYSRIRRFALLA